ncbi:MAG TPA: FtsQ-type POTRA domain-containing protein [Treponemataceae bacterium]|nr:FtsQ-type POTRA domain-containing protein [Treponemataceae bacterium]
MSDAVITGKEGAGEGSDWKPLILKALIIILSLFLLAEFTFYTIVIPMTSRINVSVIGSATIGADEICSYAGITGAEKWVNFDTARIASRLATNPLFKKVLVEKKFPDRVIVTVTERVAVAVTFGTVNGRTVPLEIDRSGMVFRIGKASGNASLPLITGLTFENPIPGVRLNAQLKPLLDDLAALEAKNPVLLSSVSEIKIAQKTYGGYDLVVYPVHTPIRVRTDKALNEDALQYMMLVLDVVDDMGLDLGEIDIRAGTVAYRVRGESLE